MKLSHLITLAASFCLALGAVSAARAEDKPAATETQASVKTEATKTEATAKVDGKADKKKPKLHAKLKGTLPVKPAEAPQHIQVQHILIAFKGTIPGKNITRTKEEADKLAHEVLQQVRDGVDFDSLVKKYTDDSPPGIYGMSNNGVAPAQGEYPRGGMVAAFGNVGFNISVGNIDIAEYDPKTSPFGWHIIKRLK